MWVMCVLDLYARPASLKLVYVLRASRAFDLWRECSRSWQVEILGKGRKEQFESKAIK